MQGEAFAALGDADTAAQALIACEEIAVRQGAHLTALRALTGLCRLDHTLAESGRQRLRQALAQFPEAADIWPLRSARRVLDRSATG